MSTDPFRRRAVVFGVMLMPWACSLDTAGLGSSSGPPSVDDADPPATATNADGSGTGPAATGASASAGSMDAGSTSAPSGTTTAGGSGGSDDTTGAEPLPPPGPYTVIAPLDTLNTDFSNEDDPTLRQDQLEIFFASDRMISEDVYVATRPSTAASFGAPTPVGVINTDFVETTPELSHDGLLLLFASDRFGSFDVFWVARPVLDSPWGVPQPLSDVNTGDQETAATPQPDGSTLLWCSDRIPSLGSADLWRGTLNPGFATVVDPMHVLALATSTLDCPGNSSDDMSWLLLESGREGSMGAHDIWAVPRVDGGLGDPINITELNTRSFDADPWVTGDLQTIYFASDRSGDYDLYVAQ